MFKKITRSAIQGLFWILPITAIVLIVAWLFNKITFLTNELFYIFGFNPEQYQLLWIFVGILIVLIMLAMIGAIATTRLATIIENLVKKIPFYATIKDIVDIFNTSKNKNDVLVVAIKGFTQQGYNIGLMYSIKESVIKKHYTVTLSMSPIPNGGFMFEVHEDDILVIEGAQFNDNLNYLLSMGTKSLTEILGIKSQQELPTLAQWLKKVDK